MNEFISKKLGEVLAFAEVSHETFERGRHSLEAGFGVERVNQAIKDNTLHAESIKKLSRECDIESIVLGKLETTGKKLRSMRDSYVGEQWDNPTELLEWSGFFEGAALVHWALVLGAAEVLVEHQKTLIHNDLLLLATSGKEFHTALLHEVTSALHAVGASKAQEEPI